MARVELLALVLAVLCVSAVRVPANDAVPDEERFSEVEGDPVPAPTPAPAPVSPPAGGPTMPPTPMPVQAATVSALKPAVIARPVDATIHLPPLPLQHPLQEVDAPVEEKDEMWLSHEDDNDPEVQKLNVAMDSVREEMMTTSHQLNKELKWINEVNKIMDEYEGKIKNVQSHVQELRRNIKQLYHKKQQLKNLRLQHQLELKQKEAQDEMDQVVGSVNNIKKKDEALAKSRADLQATINSITEQLDKLKTTRRVEQQKDKEAEAEASEIANATPPREPVEPVTEVVPAAAPAAPAEPVKA